MAFNFPNSPTVGQSYPAVPVPGQPTYVWDGEKWMGTTAGPATALPLMDGVAAVGTSVLYTRQDHIHPSDTSRTTKSYVDAGDAAATAVANLKLPLAGGTMTGQLWAKGSGYVNDPAVQQLVVQNAPGISQACMTFLASGYFGCQFGVAQDGNFYMGGISFGAAAYKFWTTRDFTSLPNISAAFTNARLAFAGDTAITPGMIEPYGGAVITGADFGSGPSAIFRWRYMQFLTTSWWTVGYV